jgi:hypothetical protein
LWRWTLRAIVVLLLAGLTLSAAGSPAQSRTTLAAAFGVLLTMPIVNLLAALAGEVRRRDWLFAGIAGVVAVLLGVSIVGALR